MNGHNVVLGQLVGKLEYSWVLQSQQQQDKTFNKMQQQSLHQLIYQTEAHCF